VLTSKKLELQPRTANAHFFLLTTIVVWPLCKTGDTGEGQMLELLTFPCRTQPFPPPQFSHNPQPKELSTDSPTG